MNTFPDNVVRTELPPPPRRVRGGPGGSLWSIRLFTLPHTLVGIGAIFVWLFLLLWVAFGTDTPGTVTSSNTSSSRKSGTTYHLKYQYQDGESLKSDSSRVSYAIYQQYQGDKKPWPKVTVHHFSIGPLNRAELRESGSLWKLPGFLTIWVLFWNCIVGIFFFQIWVKPLQLRWLCRQGLATNGTVTGKRVSTGKSSSYYVSYRFSDPTNGQPIQGEMLVWNKKLWDGAIQDQQVTVLYAPENLKRSTAYEFTGYRVV